MKRLMLVLTLIASVATADEVGRIKNDAGGAIVLTTQKCAKDQGHAAYGYSATSNDTLWGCHYYYDGAIWINWGGVSLKRYTLDSITWSEAMLKELKKDRKTY